MGVMAVEADIKGRSTTGKVGGIRSKASADTASKRAQVDEVVTSTSFTHSISRD